MLGSRLLPNVLSDDELETILSTMNKPVGSLEYDPWGYNRETVRKVVALFKWLYDRYFRVQAVGLENIPASGRCLIIANHSGQLPIDGMLLGFAVVTNPHGARAPRVMVERFFPSVPFLGNMLNGVGAVVGDPINARKMLEREEAIMVFPEGVRGAGKPWSQRYQLQRFGNGFMHLAIKHRTPIVPVGIVGCEESVPTPGHSKTLARLFGLPYFPVTLPMIWPTRVRIHVGKPMHFNDRDEDELKLTQSVEEVKTAIRGLIRDGLKARHGVFR